MPRSLATPTWVAGHVERRLRSISEHAATLTPAALAEEIDRLVGESHSIHDVECVNLNPATNVMNPKAEAMLSAGLGTRASLGYPGDKYQTGLEAIEQIEVVVAELAAEVFNARYAVVRVGSGALANLYAFMATCEPGDTIIAPPPSIGGHVTHDRAGAAGLYPLAEGAHLMTMSTYKSLGGPAGGLVVTDDDELAERLDAIAYPGLTANFDAGRTAALAVTLLDWKVAGPPYARTMITTARRLADDLTRLGVPVFAATDSHQFAVHAYHGGQAAARRLRRANLLSCGTPTEPVDGDLNGLRLGTSEIVRLGATEADMPSLASFVTRALNPAGDPADVAPDVTAWRQRFTGIHFTADQRGSHA